MTHQEFRKTRNLETFYNMEILDEAIDGKVKVKFIYMRYDEKKNFVARRSKKYTVNPYGMVHTNEQYYLVCSLAYQKNLSLYRIDRMKDIELTDYELDERETSFNPQEEVSKAVYGFTGKAEPITLICQKHILDDVIDKFGLDIRIFHKDEESYEIRLKAAPKGVKFWALQYLPYVEVVSPLWLREEIVDSIEANPYKKEFPGHDCKRGRHEDTRNKRL